MDDEFTRPPEDEWDGKTPTSLAVASALSAFAQMLKAIFMFAIDLAAVGATVYFAGHTVFKQHTFLMQAAAPSLAQTQKLAEVAKTIKSP